MIQLYHDIIQSIFNPFSSSKNDEFTAMDMYIVNHDDDKDDYTGAAAIEDNYHGVLFADAPEIDEEDEDKDVFTIDEINNLEKEDAEKFGSNVFTVFGYAPWSKFSGFATSFLVPRFEDNTDYDKMTSISLGQKNSDIQAAEEDNVEDFAVNLKEDKLAKFVESPAVAHLRTSTASDKQLPVSPIAMPKEVVHSVSHHNSLVNSVKENIDHVRHFLSS